MLSVRTRASRIARNARCTSAACCGRLTALHSASRKLWTPMLIRSAPPPTTTARRSGSAVSGDVSTDIGMPGTAPMRRTMPNSCSSWCASSSVGVPPPIAARANVNAPP